MEIYTTSEARANLYKIVDHVADFHEPIYIKGRKNKAVLISQEDYDSLMETLYLHSIPGMVKSIIDASNEPTQECIPHNKVDW